MCLWNWGCWRVLRASSFQHHTLVEEAKPCFFTFSIDYTSAISILYGSPSKESRLKRIKMIENKTVSPPSGKKPFFTLGFSFAGKKAASVWASIYQREIILITLYIPYQRVHGSCEQYEFAQHPLFFWRTATKRAKH